MIDNVALLEEITRQESLLQFKTFTNDDAIALGLQMLASASSAALPLVIDITRGQHQLFHVSLPGTRPDNDFWVARKRETVYRFGRSTYFMAQDALRKGEDFPTRYGLDPHRFVAAGGGFPVAVVGVGLVGTVTVSGLPQAEDHRFVIGELSTFLGIVLD